MEPRIYASQYDHYRGEVEAMLAVDRPLGTVERMLERAPLDAEERAALWLFAWALHDRWDATSCAEPSIPGHREVEWSAGL